MDKTFDAAAAEPRIYADWESAGAFAAGANARPGAETFTIVIPPPNVTGSLHMGHALNNTLQDILIRWHRMRGFDTLWQPGTDHAGIATQMVVERALAAEGNESRRDMGRARFVERVWQQKAESEATILGQLKRLGASCDWSRTEFTMSERLSRAVLRVFVQLYRKGLIYRDKRLVNWDPHFETAISDLEVEQVEIRPKKDGGKLWRFNYALADGATYEAPVAWDEEGKPTAFETRNYITVATTRPETMLGDTGVAVHPEDQRYAHLVGSEVILPMVGRRIPIVADEYADPEQGTGAVKITPAHDFNDFEVGKRCGLRVINVMTTKAAIWLEGNPDFLEGCQPAPECMTLHGLDRYEARLRVLRIAEAEGWLDGEDDHPHLVPHGDRSKVAIEPYLTDQWFCDAAKLAGPAVAAVRGGDTRFVPPNWDKTYYNWMENIEPWCISRQLWWGHQVPVWYGPDGTPFCAETEAEAAEAAAAHYGEAVDLTRDPDVLDTWFSSALWPFSTLGWPDETPELAHYYKTDVLITGFDIIFFWVARMMMMGLEFMRDGEGRPEVPFHSVYINSIVVDQNGKKMSKSLGNIIDPLELIDEFGADALRFTLASQEVQGRRQLRLAKTQVEGGRNFGTKLWNAARFAEANGCYEGYRPEPGAVRPEASHPVNRWILGETRKIAQATDEALGAYRFNDAANGLYAHVWGVVCDWYVEFAKPLLADGHPQQAETRACMAWALDQCLILLHPLMPFITEEIWQQLAAGAGGRPKPLIHTDWPALDAAFSDPEAERELRWVIRAIEQIRSVRAEMNVPGGAKLALVVSGHGAEVMARIERNRELIERLARIEGISEAPQPPKGAVTVAMDDCTLSLPLAGVIDVAAETARLGKAVARLDKELKQLNAKLGNEKFLAKAPEEEITKQRDRLAVAEGERQRLAAALTLVGELG
ncbi:valine--tRNA ligase [Paralimibaculum aggregatum]|uniref:Valine--tRNA ligase n=1 Tax=Paralimibaculum aggregatum TaxID=3036245 RepID=A0ABQ6LKU9_9RHOB|nr:valine--tRNA ligase [Limibaculum sp. NKW23]GMG83607.1 valine--tRNA ligase [Limibaculum sp. NKW23]